MLYLATDALPWGIVLDRPRQSGKARVLDWAPGVGYAVCCGHVLSRRAGLKLVRAGLLALNDGDRDHLVITDGGREWLNVTWWRVRFAPFRPLPGVWIAAADATE